MSLGWFISPLRQRSGDTVETVRTTWDHMSVKMPISNSRPILIHETTLVVTEFIARGMTLTATGQQTAGTMNTC